MFPSARSCAHPLIRFIGKRKWPSVPEPSHPHPAAPPEIREHFANSKRDSTTQQTASNERSLRSPSTYTQFWEAPSKYWKPRVREVPESEIEAIMSGGASSYGTA